MENTTHGEQLSVCRIKHCVGILTLTSRTKIMLSSVEHDILSITSEPEECLRTLSCTFLINKEPRFKALDVRYFQIPYLFFKIFKMFMRHMQQNCFLHFSAFPLLFK